TALHAAHAGAIDVTVGQHHFHAALHHEVLTVGGVAHAPVHGVAHRAGDGRRRRERQHHRQVVFLDVVVQLAVGNTRLDQGVAHFRVDLDDPVHLFQIQDHLAALHGRRRAVAEVAPGGDGPDRDAVLVADLHHFLDLLDGGRGQRGGGGVRGIFHRHHDLVVGHQLLLLYQYVFITQQGAELAHRLVEVGLRYPFG